MDRLCDMGIFLILLIIDLTTADKLDRSYLPPPGDKFSGGSPEDLQIPFEFPKGPKEATSKIVTIVPDRGILTSGYYVGSTVEPNIGEIFDTIFDSKSQESYFSNTSPTASYKYFPTASTKRPLEIDQDIKNFDSQKHDTNLDYFVPNTPITDTFPRISEDSVSAYQYSAVNVPFYDTTIKPTVSDNIKQYLNINEGNPALVSQILNPQNQVMSHSENKAPIYGQKTIVTSTDNIQNLNSDFVPITNNYQSNDSIKKLKHVPNSKSIDNDLNSYRKPGNNKLDSTIPTSDIKPKLSTPETMISVPIFKSRPFSPKITTRIASGRIRQHLERPQAEADRNAVILNYHNVLTPNGYSYTYDTSNGISANESGTANNGVRVHGDYTYIGDDGKVYRVVYTADENGFLPRGDHIPPVPIATRRLIEAAREREAGISDDGSYNEAKYGHTRYEGAMERYHPKFQGITNNALNQFGDYSRKRFGSKGRQMNTVLELKQLEYKGKNYGIHGLNHSNRYQVSSSSSNRVVLPTNLGKGTKKQFENSLTRTAGSKNTDDATERKKVHDLLDQQNVKKKLILGMTKSADFSNKQEQRLPNKPTNLAISSDYSPKKIFPTKQNIPEIIESSNANVIENNKAFLADNEDGYFYITPKNKFIENGNQASQTRQKDRNLFTTDQELEIGDDNIITISVPSPNTFARVDNEVLQTVSPYNRQYNLENLSPMHKKDNQGIDHAVNPNNATYNINLLTMSSDINIQPKVLISPANYEISMNPTGDTGDGKYANVKKPEGQIVFENGAPYVTVEFARSITKDLRTPLKFYGQKPNISLSDFGNNFGIADSDDLEKDAEINVSNTNAYEKGFESSKSINNYDPDRISNPTAKSIIGEDFTGPKRPQTFDPQNGYYY